jgi:hypothetical protein
MANEIRVLSTGRTWSEEVRRKEGRNAFGVRRALMERISLIKPIRRVPLIRPTPIVRVPLIRSITQKQF